LLPLCRLSDTSTSYAQCFPLFCLQDTGDIRLTLPVRSCLINIVYDYGNKKHVFRLVTTRRSAYLFEVDNDEVMLDWIRAIKLCSLSDDEEVD